MRKLIKIIINYINHLYVKAITNRWLSVALFSLLINIVLTYYYLSLLNTMPSAVLTDALCAQKLMSEGINSKVGLEYAQAMYNFTQEIVLCTRPYGLLDEQELTYKLRALIIKYPAWLDYYQKYRLKIWQKCEDQRLADQQLFPDYQPETSELIAQALSSQHS